MGGDERAALHALIAAIADRPAALVLLRTLLLSLGREAAAGVVDPHAANRHGWQGEDRPLTR